jgi:hypothetical protein
VLSVDDAVELGDGAKGLGVRDDYGAVEAVQQEADPEDTTPGLALRRAGHDDADVCGEVAPVAEDEKGAGDAHCCEVRVVGVASSGDQAVLARAESDALGVEGLVGGVGVGCAKECFVGVNALTKEPEDGIGEALGYVRGRGKAEAQYVLGDPSRDVGALLVGDPEEGCLVPLAGVCGELVEEIFEVVGELKDGKAEGAAGVEEDGHVVGKVGKIGFDFAEPGGHAGGGVQ